MLELFTYDFMQRAAIAAVLVGISAPLVGTFLVQRRLALVGDGIGHVALAGVAAGFLTMTEPVLTALIAAVIGAVAIELMRHRGGTSGDMALAVLFYGGIAAGVVLVSQSPQSSPASLHSYLFGSITTTTPSDVLYFAVLAAVILLTVALTSSRLFLIGNDEEYARAAGLNVLAYNIVLAVLTAATVVLSMRVIGLLLISALMILPNAVAQQIAGSFKTTVLIAMVVGVALGLFGVVLSYEFNLPSGGTIVLLGIATFLLTSVGRRVSGRLRAV